MTASPTDTAQTEQFNEYPLEEEYGIEVVDFETRPCARYEIFSEEGAAHMRTPFRIGHWWEHTDDEPPDWYDEQYWSYEPCATLEALSADHVPDVPESVEWSQYRSYTCQHPQCHDDCINRSDSPYAVTGFCRYHYNADRLRRSNPCRITALPAEHRPDVSGSLEWSEYEHYRCRKCWTASNCINPADSVYALSRLCRLCYAKLEFYGDLWI